MDTRKARSEIVKFGRLLYRNRFIAGYDGNLSIRLSKTRIMITPTLTAKGFMSNSDPIVVDLSGKKFTGRKNPSSETAMHLRVYDNRVEIGACCHAHPPHATALAVSEGKIPHSILPEVALVLGEVKTVEYIPTGLAEKWNRLDRYLNEGFAWLLKNHGVLTVGRTLEEAYFRMETVEHCARIIYIAESRGRLSELDSKELKRLDKIREKLFSES